MKPEDLGLAGVNAIRVAFARFHPGAGLPPLTEAEFSIADVFCLGCGAAAGPIASCPTPGCPNGSDAPGRRALAMATVAHFEARITALEAQRPSPAAGIVIHVPVGETVVIGGGSTAAPKAEAPPPQPPAPVPVDATEERVRELEALLAEAAEELAVPPGSRLAREHAKREHFRCEVACLRRWYADRTRPGAGIEPWPEALPEAADLFVAYPDLAPADAPSAPAAPPIATMLGVRPP